jgi:hypothetical protein
VLVVFVTPFIVPVPCPWLDPDIFDVLLVSWLLLVVPFDCEPRPASGVAMPESAARFCVGMLCWSCCAARMLFGPH